MSNKITAHIKEGALEIAKTPANRNPPLVEPSSQKGVLGELALDQWKKSIAKTLR